MSEVLTMDAGDFRRLELLLKALMWHRREHEEYSLAECLEYLHRDHTKRAGLPEPDEAGDNFVARELAHAHAVLDALCGAPMCRVPGCGEEAPAYWGLCLHHDLERALRLDAE